VEKWKTHSNPHGDWADRCGKPVESFPQLFHISTTGPTFPQSGPISPPGIHQFSTRFQQVFHNPELSKKIKIFELWFKIFVNLIP